MKKAVAATAPPPARHAARRFVAAPRERSCVRPEVSPPSPVPTLARNPDLPLALERFGRRRAARAAAREVGCLLARPGSAASRLESVRLGRRRPDRRRAVSLVGICSPAGRSMGGQRLLAGSRISRSRHSATTRSSVLTASGKAAGGTTSTPPYALAPQPVVETSAAEPAGATRRSLAAPPSRQSRHRAGIRNAVADRQQPTATRALRRVQADRSSRHPAAPAMMTPVERLTSPPIHPSTRSIRPKLTFYHVPEPQARERRPPTRAPSGSSVRRPGAEAAPAESIRTTISVSRSERTSRGSCAEVLFENIDLRLGLSEPAHRSAEAPEPAPCGSHPNAPAADGTRTPS